MATDQEKQDLIEVLKFTPVKVNLLLQGYGGETYAGRVDRKIYEYFKENEYDIEEYACDSDGEWVDRVPDAMQPFCPGSGYDCDNLWHSSGATLDECSYVTVVNEDGDELWEHNLDENNLEDAGVTVEESDSTCLEDLADGTVVYWGGQGEKGCFFDAEFVLRQPFDPKKLKITYEDCDGWRIVSGVEYDGEELEGSDGYSTSGKWGENKWIIIGDEEVYDAVSLDDREEDDDEE